MDLIEIRNVTKSFQTGLFNQQTILENIDLTVRQDDFVVLRGINGAGKSTLLKIILGLQEPDSGSVKLCGLKPTAPEAKLQVGTVFQEVTPPNSLKVKELIDLIGSYYPNPIATKDILETVGLTELQQSMPSELAGGQKQRLYFAIALVGNPKLLILDEPTKNLDAEGQAVFWHQVVQLRQRGVTILMVTHIQSEQAKLQRLATHIITLTDGKLICNWQPARPRPRTASAAPILPKGANPVQVLVNQIGAEILQLMRTPTYLAGVFLFSAFVAVMPFNNHDPQQLSQGITFFSATSLLLFSVERLGKRIAIERVEGWLKLLRATPLQSSVYLLAKLTVTLLILMGSLAIIFAIGIFKFGLSHTLTQWLILISSLLLGIIPFAIIGIALGYGIPPKALDSITGLLIPMGMFFCGLIPIQNLNFLTDFIVVFPFFHYREIIQSAVGSESDHQLLLHVLWLVLYGIIASLAARFAYRRDRLVL